MLKPREELIDQLFESMYTAKRAIYGSMQTVMKDCPISPAHVELLATIKQLQPISFSLLAQHLKLTPGAVSQLAEGLETHQFITRQKDPSDRRVQSLLVSKRGDKQLTDMEKRRRSTMLRAMEDLSTEELATWVHIQQKLIAHFQADTIKPNATERPTHATV